MPRAERLVRSLKKLKTIMPGKQWVRNEIVRFLDLNAVQSCEGSPKTIAGTEASSHSI